MGTWYFFEVSDRMVSALSEHQCRFAGASWIFTRDQLDGALLAIRMNGAPLTRDHGAPVRLIVPGWYGCCCIKWVDRIELVPDAAPATTNTAAIPAALSHRAATPGRFLMAATASPLAAASVAP